MLSPEEVIELRKSQQLELLAEVCSLYYEQEMNLREIGAVLSISESRVCQIHGQAMLRLRSRLGEWNGITAENDD